MDQRHTVAVQHTHLQSPRGRQHPSFLSAADYQFLLYSWEWAFHSSPNSLPKCFCLCPFVSLPFNLPHWLQSSWTGEWIRQESDILYLSRTSWNNWGVKRHRAVRAEDAEEGADTALLWEVRRWRGSGVFNPLTFLLFNSSVRFLLHLRE